MVLKGLYFKGWQGHNRRFKLKFGFGLGEGVPVSFSPTRLIIFLLHADWLAEINKFLIQNIGQSGDGR